MFAGACYTGGVVCPYNDVCPNHQVLGEYMVSNNYAAWYGATGSTPWDPPVTMLLALGSLVGGTSGHGTAHGITSGTKTLGAAIAAANAAMIDAHGCAGSQCNYDVGGGMTALQFILIGDAAMFISTIDRNHIDVDMELKYTDSWKYDLEIKVTEDRLLCVLSDQWQTPRVCVTTKTKNSSAIRKCTIQDVDNYMYENSHVSCQGAKVLISFTPSFTCDNILPNQEVLHI
jgi:hypothetical protein